VFLSPADNHLTLDRCESPPAQTRPYITKKITSSSNTQMLNMYLISKLVTKDVSLRIESKLGQEFNLSVLESG